MLYLQLKMIIKLKEFNKNNIEKLSKFLESKRKIVLTPHVNPDGDAIGSALGLFHILKNIGHSVTVVTPNEYPDFLQWLPGNELVMNHSKQKNAVQKIIDEADLIFALDFNHLDRTDKLENIFMNSKALKIMIDHHPEPQEFADIIFSETKVSSTSELVYLLIKELDLLEKIDINAATCLYTGIMTDTGRFNYNCSHPTTLKVASELIAYKINTDRISSLVYDNFSADRMQLMGYSLHEKMKIYPEFNTAIIPLDKSELKRFNYKPGDTEGFVNLPLSINGIVFSILLLEKNDHVKLSLRSRGNFPANKFAINHFDGGGHLNAAGGQSNLSLENTLIKIDELLLKYKSELINSSY
ncbi:bifunctional oligoribonuclease/PAP phosphatase NrnA [Bacteroidota bacterium]